MRGFHREHKRTISLECKEIVSCLAFLPPLWYHGLKKDGDTMFQIIKSSEQLTIKGYRLFAFIGVFALFMGAQVLRLLFLMEPFSGEFPLSDLPGFIFLCLWIVLVWTLGLSAIATSSKQIVIDSEGILCKTWFRKQYIKWPDVKDFGISYCGQTRGEGNTYYLYFSKHECPVKNQCRKKLKGKIIKTYVFEGHYTEVVNKVLPFCKDKTDIPPFVGKDKFHFI